MADTNSATLDEVCVTAIAEAFRGDGGLSWGDHHPCLFSGTEWFFRTGYRAELPGWVESLDGVAANPELNLGDGIHPNERGHQVVADNVWKVLEPVLRAEAAEQPARDAA